MSVESSIKVDYSLGSLADKRPSSVTMPSKMTGESSSPSSSSSSGARSRSRGCSKPRARSLTRSPPLSDPLLSDLPPLECSAFPMLLRESDELAPQYSASVPDDLRHLVCPDADLQPTDEQRQLLEIRHFLVQLAETPEHYSAARAALHTPVRPAAPDDDELRARDWLALGWWCVVIAPSLGVSDPMEGVRDLCLVNAMTEAERRGKWARVHPSLASYVCVPNLLKLG